MARLVVQDAVKSVYTVWDADNSGTVDYFELRDGLRAGITDKNAV